MFNSSLRRVARSCPNGSLSPLRPSSPGHTTAIAATFTTHSHQRRNSSSKPPIPPNNGHPTIPTTSVKQVGAPRSSTDKRPGTESRLAKRKSAKGEKIEVKTNGKKEDAEVYSNEWTSSLPSVPSTQHLNPKDVYVASFFSTHRPISITGPLPPETSISDIDKIFAIRPKSQRKTQDIIFTLSSAVQNLDQQVENQQATQQEEAMTQRADIIKALTQHNQANGATGQGQQDGNVHHLDGQPGQSQMRVGGNVKLVIQALARQFRPFNPPPAPTAAPEIEFYPAEQEQVVAEESQAAALEAEIIQQDPETLLAQHVQRDQPQISQVHSQSQAEQHQQSAAEKSKDNTFFTPSFNYARRTQRGVLLASHIHRIRAGIRIPGLERMKMYLISVKRQRRLKMKKHKYKKLQRKTRNLRRRQGKI